MYSGVVFISVCKSSIRLKRVWSGKLLLNRQGYWSRLPHASPTCESITIRGIDERRLRYLMGNVGFGGFIAAAILFMSGCANDVPSLPDNCETVSCTDGQRAGETDAAGVSVPPSDVDASSMPSGSDTRSNLDSELDDVADSQPDAIADTQTTADEDARTDSTSTPLQEPLFRYCSQDADCPVLETRCLRELLWSHNNTVSPLALDRIVPDIPEGMGICTADCAAPGSRCERLRSGSPETPWACQLVAWQSPPHPGAVPGVRVEFPLPAVPDADALSAGVPFAAMCRPDPATLRNDSLSALCRPCIVDEDCGSGAECVNRALELGADSARETQPGVCMLACVADRDCPDLFRCDASIDAEAGRCLPVAETCGGCLDLDRDGHGIGRCTEQGTAGSLDCDDLNSAAFYSGPSTPPDPDACSDSLDINCNGMADASELIGEGEWGYRHCTSCNDPCDETVITADTGPNGEVACAELDGAPPACVAVCAAGFADCNNDVSDGCETPIDTLENCGACRNQCDSPGPDVPELVCRTIDDAEFATDFVCAIGECAENRLDCDGLFETGCEIDGATDVQNCGACGVDCTGRLDNAEEICAAGQCAVASCDGEWGDCDGVPVNGCETDTSSSFDHCGACGNDCRLANAESSCESGSCEIVRCNSGFGDCDGDPGNGCEIDLRTSVDHCGTCSRACSFPNAEAVCNAGRCEQNTCERGYADCTSLQPGCETRLDSVPNCGACGATCSAIPANLRVCALSGPSDVTGECECDDSATDGQVCNGLASVCGQDVDEGCPDTLSGIGSVRPQQWLKFDPAYPPYTDHSAPAIGTFTIYRYLTGFEVTYDNYALIQLQPYWANALPLEGVGTATELRNYSFYQPEESPWDASFRGTEIIGAETRLIDLPLLATMTPARNVRTNVRLNCDNEPRPSTRSFMLPVAIRLFALDGQDRDISGIQLECQAFEIRIADVTADVDERYTIEPTGPVQLTEMVGRGFVALGRSPDIDFTRIDATPIIRLDGDRRSLSFPLRDSRGVVETFGSPIYAIRPVVSGSGWGL